MPLPVVYGVDRHWKTLQLGLTALAARWHFISDAHAALTLFQRIGQLRGPLMKMAQITALLPDVLPPIYQETLRQLCETVPSMGWPLLRRHMALSLGHNWAIHFRFFDTQAAYSASLGQVHWATLSNGDAVACKIQYPDIHRAIEGDLTLLKQGMSLYHKAGKGFCLDGLYTELRTRLKEEMDYRCEAKHMLLFDRILDDQADIHIPRPIFSASSLHVLTMTRMSGVPLITRISDHNFLHQMSQASRNILAHQLLRAWYLPFFRAGILHGDPHIGNILIAQENTEDQSIAVVDFGCVKRYEACFVQAFVDLYHAAHGKDKQARYGCYVRMGINVWPDQGKNVMIDALDDWVMALLHPFVHEKIILDLSHTKEIRQKLTYLHEICSRYGGLAIPEPFLIFDRVALILGSIFVQLHADIDWFSAFGKLCSEFSLDGYQQWQKKLDLLAHCNA